MNKDKIPYQVAFTEGYSIVRLYSYSPVAQAVIRSVETACDLFEYGVDRRLRKTDCVNSHTVLLYATAIYTVKYNV
jgi:hypothetical protein